MKATYLVRHDEAKNMHRFYQLMTVPGVFGDWSLVKEWGRLGSPGTVRSEWFETEVEAIKALDEIFKKKRKKGYLSV